MRNLIIADTQDITRVGIKSMVRDIKDISQVYEVGDKSDLIHVLSENIDGLIILDYTLFDFESINDLQILSERYPKSDWILFSDELSDSFLKQVQSNNLPFSIVLKSCPLPEIDATIRSALFGESFYCKRVDNHMKTLSRSLDSASDHNLTQTEKEILKEIALGHTTKEIAAERHLSFHTVITHRKNIFRKLEVNNVHEATKYAMKAGIVDVSEYYI
ncbi:DNA-binding NarL/FixJ family response regulator [Dysgonomonas alginatilytica]|uniref:DNA-binding NarL/FixJ family response regulator n=1 Tax=Dysgonomonas alginatilytica TaxID=1605892 RepID=A0A2V3PPR0_9BACT|nr:response regulator transcription factor [Dysgonomonas alginatilytica]PXV62863.1 DNA-binding NarL/FixJ family response regulator [Dysgonomonas alginatilytica]